MQVKQIYQQFLSTEKSGRTLLSRTAL